MFLIHREHDPDRPPLRLSPPTVALLARAVADQAERESVVAQATEDAALVKRAQHLGDLAEILYHRATGEPLRPADPQRQ